MLSRAFAGRRDLEVAVVRRCDRERSSLAGLTYQLGEWAGPNPNRTPAGSAVDTAIAAYVERAEKAGQDAGRRAGLRTGLAVAVLVLILGVVAGLLAKVLT